MLKTRSNNKIAALCLVGALVGVGAALPSYGEPAAAEERSSSLPSLAALWTALESWWVTREPEAVANSEGNEPSTGEGNWYPSLEPNG